MLINLIRHCNPLGVKHYERILSSILLLSAAGIGTHARASCEGIQFEGEFRMKILSLTRPRQVSVRTLGRHGYYGIYVKQGESEMLEYDFKIDADEDRCLVRFGGSNRLHQAPRFEVIVQDDVLLLVEQGRHVTEGMMVALKRR